MTDSSDQRPPFPPDEHSSTTPPTRDDLVDVDRAGDAVFRTDDLEADLPRRSVRSGAAIVGSQAVSFGFTMIGIAILARLLTPDDFGLVEMVIVFLMLVQTFQEMGLGESTIQQSTITHRQISTLFWVNTGIGFIGAAVMALLAWPIAWFFERPELVGVTLALSTTFILAGLVAQHVALLRRRMRFGVVSVIYVSARVFSLVVAVVAALLGAGYWALVLMRIGFAVGLLVGSWSSVGWMPGPPGPIREVGAMLRFGGYLAGAKFTDALVRTVDRMLIGRLQTAEMLGQYSKAYQLLMLPVVQLNTPITTVAVPTLSRLQDDPERFRLYYQRGIEIIAAMTFPIVFGCLAAAETIILGLLGAQWGPAVPLFRALAPASLFVALSVSTDWVFVSLGQTDRQFRWRLVASLLIVAAFLIGAAWGAMGIAVGFSISASLAQVGAALYCFRGNFIRLADLLSVIWRPAFAAASAGVVTGFAERLLVDPIEPLYRLPILIAIFGVIYLMGWILVPGGRSRLAVMLAVGRYLRPGGPRPPSHEQGTA